MADIPEAFKVEVNGQYYDVDLLSFTLGERRTIRLELAKLDGDTDGYDFTAGMIWVTVRRDQPDITLQQILDGVTIGALVPAEVAEDDPEG